ncbi:MAG TPA: hypothetical protein VMR49_02985 [Candidatus Paceibacterota bacterium]|nr:hypothetical protein [Candidatus Paceibacterota bacterium]
MKRINTIVVLMFVLISFYGFRSFAQTSDLATALRSKVIILPGFRENILPYINLKTSNKEKMHIESHILSSDMTIEDMIVSFGVRALDANDMVSLLTNALVSGDLKGIRLIKKGNLFFVLINHGDYDTGYFVDLFWSPSHNCWALNAHSMDKVYAKKGVQVFNSY